MRTLFTTIFGLLLHPAISQNVGIGHNNAEAILDIYGDLILRSADLILENGNTTNADVGSNPFSNFRITGPSADFTLSGIAYSPDGKLLTFFNRSGFVMTVENESPSAEASERILTGTGAPITIPHNASINFQYDGAAQRWVVRSHSAIPSSSGGGSIGWNENMSHIYNSNTGNVGIGTMWPGYKLHVNGQGHLYNPAPITFSEGQQGGYYFFGGSLSLSSPNLENFPAGIENNYLAFDGHRMQAFVRRMDDGSVSDYARSITLNPFGGSVGIGTNYPIGYAKLEILTAPESRALSLSDGTVAMVHFLGGNGRGVNGKGGYIGTSTNHPLHFYTNSQWAHMTLLQNGALCFGTLTAATGYRLNVAGKIMAEEIRVQSYATWPDYVFKKDYPLPTLPALEAEINKLGHLPGIPDAQTIEKEGFTLGDMQRRLLEKVEEITLYLIRMEKANQQLRLEINQLKAEKKY